MLKTIKKFFLKRKLIGNYREISEQMVLKSIRTGKEFDTSAFTYFFSKLNAEEREVMFDYLSKIVSKRGKP